jgi:uncharacterized damage-inducible protein DinB
MPDVPACRSRYYAGLVLGLIIGITEFEERAMKENSDAPRRELILSSVGCEAPEVDVWLSALSDCRARTHKAIAGIQTDELDWMCPLSRNTIGTVLYHIAAIELDWLYSEILEHEFPDDFRTWFPYDVRDSEGNLTPITADGAQEHDERLHYVRDKLVGTLGAMSPLEFHRVRHLQAYDVTPQWVVHHLLQHEAEHRGQIAILRRRFKDFVSPP